MGPIQKFMAAACAVAAVAITAGQAQAATWVLDYQATYNPSPFAANLTLTTGDTALPDGSYAIIGITGTVDNGGGNSDAVTGLINNPNSPSWSFSPDGLFMFDNLVFPTAPPTGPAVSWYGLMFTGASGAEYNLFSDNANTYELYRAQGGGYQANSYGTVSVAAVPEPAAWLLMIVGFGGAGAILRRRRSAPAAA